MKVSLVNVLMLGSGVILLYSGVKGYDPRDVIRWGLGGKKPEKMKSSEDFELGHPKDHPDPGQRHPGDKHYEYDEDKDGDGWPDGRVISV